MKSLLFSLLVSSLLVGTCERRPGQGAGANADTTALGPKNEIGSHPSPQIGGLSAGDSDSIAQQELMRLKLDIGESGRNPGKGSRDDIQPNWPKIEEARRMNAERMRLYDSLNQVQIRQKRMEDSIMGTKQNSPEQK